MAFNDSNQNHLCNIGGALTIDGHVDELICENWSKNILSRKKVWTDSFGRNSFTFGNAWYVLLEKGLLHKYHAESQLKNQLIEELHGYLDAMLAAKDYLAPPEDFRDIDVPLISRSEKLGPFWCWSGVHLSKSNRGGSAHADFEGLSPYPERIFSPDTRAFSALLSIQKPAWGGGLKVWEGRMQGDHTDEMWEQHLCSANTKIYNYPTGTLTIIDSFLVHQILPAFTWGNRFRMVGVMHFLFHETPHPHWEYWF